MTSPGWLNGTGARSRDSPYTFSKVSADSRIQPRLASIPTVTAATTPCHVVRGQKSTITRAGRFALAAMLKAQPTRKLTLKLRKRMPNAIATMPRATAAILPHRTFS